MADKLNTEWKQRCKDKVNGVYSCDDLQEYSIKLMQQLVAQQTAAAANTEPFQTLYDLLDAVKSAPTDIADVIAYLTDVAKLYVEMMTVYLKPITDSAALILDIIAFSTEMLALIQTKMSELVCTFTLPSPPTP